MINDVRYACSKRIVTNDTIKYLSVTPNPGAISGTIQLYRDDGFLMCEDDVSKFARHIMAGSILTLTNKSQQTNQTVEVSTNLTYAESAAAIREGVNEV
jgi:hypothetical protein